MKIVQVQNGKQQFIKKICSQSAETQIDDQNCFGIEEDIRRKDTGQTEVALT